MRLAAAVASGGLALSDLPGRREPDAAGQRLGCQSGVSDLFTMRKAVPEGALALSGLHGSPTGREPGTEAKKGGNVTCLTNWRGS